MTLRVLAFDGSGRTGSMNAKLLAQAVAALEADGVAVTQVQLRDYDLPIYDGDLEAEHGLPENVLKLKKLFNQHPALLIASPEYNGAPTPLLKNALDWVSRTAPGETPTQSLKGKVAGLLAASPGKLGGLRSLIQLNTILFGVGVLVLPEIVSVGFYNDAFDDGGKLKNEPDRKAVAALTKRLQQITKAIA